MKLPKTLQQKLIDFIILCVVTFTLIWLYPVLLFLGISQSLAAIAVLTAAVLTYVFLLVCFQYAPKKAFWLLKGMALLSGVAFLGTILIALAFRNLWAVIAFLIGISFGIGVKQLIPVFKKLKQALVSP
jgi:hypothetical protein